MANNMHFPKRLLSSFPVLGGVLLLLVLLSMLTNGGATGADREATNGYETDGEPDIPMLLGNVEAAYAANRGVLGADGKAYFLGETRVSVIDGTKPAIEIPLPDFAPKPGLWPWDIARDPVTGLIYVSDNNGNAIHVIDDTKVITTLTVDITGTPQQLATDEEEGEVYHFYISQRSGAPQQYMTVISGTEIVTDVLLPHFVQIARYNPIDGRIYIGSNSLSSDGKRKNALFVVDKHQVISPSIYPLSEPYATVVDLAINSQTGDFSILLTNQLQSWNSRQKIASIDLFHEGYRSLGCLSVDPTRGWSYVCGWSIEEEAGYMLVVDKDELIAEIPLQQSWPVMSTVDVAHDYVYVANYDPTYFSVIRGAEFITTVDIIGFGTMNMLVDEERGYVYTANADGGTVSVYGFDSTTRPPTFWDFFPFVGR
ncbi:MAG: hypothetical protein H6642_02455 [Caldilineaceae bacterium]|nr:hypothetical protein [Caldilineaceae bacterium]